jgi:hypothetical protein
MRNQIIEERVALARGDAPDRICRYQCGVARAKPNLVSRSPHSKFLRLSYDESKAAFTVLEQILVAKNETRAARCSDNSKV